MMYVLLIVGFVLLIKGADLFVDGASSIAGTLKVPSIIIGLTIVSLGTSAPEAAVSITASLGGSNDLSLGNIVGSNIFILLVVIGACSLVFPAKAPEDILKRDLWWNIGVTVLLLVLLIDGSLTLIDGIILLIILAAYLFIVIRSALRNRMEEKPQDLMPIWKSILFIAIGLAGVIFGGQLVVDNASLIGKQFGMDDTLVGLTIVAIGTSLPELVTSLVASKKGDSGIALGNAVGSCLFNILFILGSTSVISPINANGSFFIDVSVLIAITVLIAIAAITKKKINRIEGGVCVALYAGYTAYIIMRAYELLPF